MKSYKFYIKMDGQIFGPYSLQEYHELDVPDDTEVLEESVGQWCLASDYPSYEELKAREEGYFIRSNGEVERVNDDEEGQYDDYEDVTAVEDVDEPDIPQQQPTDTANYQTFYDSTPTAQPNLGWNWGAFMFNWLWGVFNGIYWPLIIIPLALIPHIGGLISLAFCIALGYKGSYWAWKAKTWDSAEHFNNIQHRWAVASGIYIIVIIVIIIIALITN